jgi:hypothetical protein
MINRGVEGGGGAAGGLEGGEDCVDELEELKLGDV